MHIAHNIDEITVLKARDHVFKKVQAAGKNHPGHTDIIFTIWEAQALLNVLDEIHQEIFERD